MSASLSRRLAAEALGSAFLLAAVVGSGIMGERLAGRNGALALLCNTIPTGAILVTANIDQMLRVQGLVVEDWSAEGSGG